MKVLFVIESLGAGGTERSLAELLEPLAARGVEGEVACFLRRPGLHEEVERRGVKVTVLPAGGWAGRIAALRRLIRTAAPDLVHTALVRADLAGRLAAAGTGTRVLTSLVSTPYDPLRLADPAVRRWRLARLRLLDGLTARRLCDHFHAVSRAAARAAVDALGIDPERITVVPRGRDPRRLGAPSPQRRARARRSLGLSDGELAVVAAGRHEFAKGHVHLVEAIGRLAETRPGATLLIAGGEGGSTVALRNAAAPLGDRVRILGHREDLPEILAAADVFAFPSLYEGLPGAVIEAMALGLPVVASDIPPVRELVEPERSGLLVPCGDAQALEAAIGRLAGDPGRAAALGRRGREIFLQRFTLERSAEGMAALYRRLAAEAPRGR